MLSQEFHLDLRGISILLTVLKIGKELGNYLNTIAENLIPKNSMSLEQTHKKLKRYNI